MDHTMMAVLASDETFVSITGSALIIILAKMSMMDYPVKIHAIGDNKYLIYIGGGKYAGSCIYDSHYKICFCISMMWRTALNEESLAADKRTAQKKEIGIQ